MAHTIIVDAADAESAAMQYIDPYSVSTKGEYFRDRGEDALINYDDLTKQAWDYRQVSQLLPSRPPCSTSHRIPAAPWASISATAVKMP